MLLLRLVIWLNRHIAVYFVYLEAILLLGLYSLLTYGSSCISSVNILVKCKAEPQLIVIAWVAGVALAKWLEMNVRIMDKMHCAGLKFHAAEYASLFRPTSLPESAVYKLIMTLPR